MVSSPPLFHKHAKPDPTQYPDPMVASTCDCFYDLTDILAVDIIDCINSEELWVNKNKKWNISILIFFLIIFPAHVCLLLSESQWISAFSLSFDALWQFPFTFNTSHSSAVTDHLMRSINGNLQFIINKSLMPFVWRSAENNYSQPAFQLAALHISWLYWLWNWADLLLTVNERNWKIFQIVWNPTSQVPHHLISYQNWMFTHQLILLNGWCF